MFGQFHIEMAFLSALENLVEEIGWATKYVRQVTTCCLEEILQAQGSSGASFFGKEI